MEIKKSFFLFIFVGFVYWGGGDLGKRREIWDFTFLGLFFLFSLRVCLD